MDSSYNKVSPQFRNALSILATIISAKADFAVADVGLKGMGNEFGLPVVAGRPDAKARYIAEEHLPLDGLKAATGQKIQVIPRTDAPPAICTAGCGSCAKAPSKTSGLSRPSGCLE